LYDNPAGAKAEIVNVLDVDPVNPSPEATSAYPVPERSIDKSLNVAMPPAADRVRVPASVPLPAFVPNATVTFALDVCTRFPLRSSMRTVTAGESADPTVVLDGCCSNVNWVAKPAITSTVSDCVIAILLTVAVTTLLPATLDVSAVVSTPAESITPEAGVSVAPPVTNTPTVAPRITLSFASRAVTTIVLLPLPATMLLGAAATSERAADIAPGVTFTITVLLRATALIVAESVFSPATLEP
jgi:hypothetical protein